MSERIREGWAGMAPLWTEAEAQSLLETALTRKAWNEENGRAGQSDHESLEWLGDRMLGAVAAEELWGRFPGASESELDGQRIALTSEGPLDEIGRALGLPEGLRAGRGEVLNDQLSGKAISDHVESLVGAAFLAGGYPGAKAWVHWMFEGRWPEELAVGRDPMSLLNERVQRRWKRSLSTEDEWRVERVSSENEPPVHQAWATLPDGTEVTGGAVQGKAQKAKAAAARVALAKMDAVDNGKDQ